MSSIYFRKIVFAAVGVVIGLGLSSGAFAQGKHDGGNKHGGGGHEMKQDRGGGGRAKFENRGGARGNGNGNGWGHSNQENRGGDRRVFQQQQQQQRHNDQFARQQLRQNQQQVRQQQNYQQQVVRQQRQQQQYQQQAWRQQQQLQQRYDDRGARGRGKHNDWNAGAPRGNAYGRRGIWPGEFRGWRDPDKQARKADRRSNGAYYYSDPIARFIPSYRRPNYSYYGYNSYNRSPYTRTNVVRSIISSFFAPDAGYYDNYYDVPAYRRSRPSYYGYAPNYQPTYYYSTASYSPGYASPVYRGGYYDPYYGSPLYGTQIFGGGLKGSLLSVGLQLMEGLLGQGYSQGITQGVYARTYTTRTVRYYDPYAAADPDYSFSPYSTCFADQRQLLEEGYRLGYQDGMRNRDPYGTAYGGNRVDLLSEYLATTVVTHI